MEDQYKYYIPDQEDRTEEVEPVKEQKKFKDKKRSKVLFTVCLAVIFGLVGGVTFQSVNLLTGKLFGTGETKGSGSQTIGTAKLTQTSNTVNSDISGVAQNAMPSVVSITNMSVQQVQRFFGGVSEEEVQSSGSGIIIGENEKELLIVTNNHVVQGSETLTVTFVDAESVEGTIKGTDAKKDLAVVSIPLKDIPQETKDAIKVATLGDSTKLKVGEPAIAIGNALGYGQAVTTGVISATERDIKMQGFDETLIQTDAAINPGNSGGALLNANGELIGINTIKVSDSAVEGMGYAIPISDAKDIITNLMNKETREKVAESNRGYLGIRGVDVTGESAQMYNMPRGVYVSETVKGSGADQAGLKKGFVITAINGESISTMAELQGQLEYYAAGEKVKMTIQVPDAAEGYSEKIIDITLTENKG